MERSGEAHSGPRARIVVAPLAPPPPRIEKGAVLAQETREDVHFRRRPLRYFGGCCTGIGLVAMTPPFLLEPNGATLAILFGGVLLLLMGIAVLLVAGARYRPAVLFENGVEWRDFATNLAIYYPFRFVSEIQSRQVEFLGEVYWFRTKARVNELILPARTEFAKRAVARAREVLAHPERPVPTTNPWVAQDAAQSRRRANVK